MNSVLNRTSDKLQILRLIAENMVKTRPQVNVEYRPCIKQVGVKRNRLSFTDVDLKEIYPEATVGDVAYASVTVDVPHDETVSIGVKGNVKIFFCGEEICRHNNTTEPKFITADVIKGGNKLIIECQCTEESFGFSLIVATKYYPRLEAKDYLFHVDMNVPIDEFTGEEGFAFSKLYKKEIPHSECEYILPTNSGSDENIDFNSVYGTEKDGVGWALSYFSTDGTIEISSADAVYVNRKNVMTGF